MAVLGFLRHDRFQSRLRFDFAAGPLAVEVETLIDGVPFETSVEAERLVLLGDADVETGLRRWARHVAGPRPRRRAWGSGGLRLVLVVQPLCLAGRAGDPRHLAAPARSAIETGPLEIF